MPPLHRTLDRRCHRRPASRPNDENLHPSPQRQPVAWKQSPPTRDAGDALQAGQPLQPDRTVPAKGGEGGETVCDDRVSSADMSHLFWVN